MGYLLTTSNATPRVIKEQMDTDESLDGWDTAVIRRTVRADSAEQARGMIGLGAALGDVVSAPHPYLVCVASRARERVCTFYETEHTFRGVFSTDKPYKVRITNNSERQSTQSGLYPGEITPVPLESNQGLISLVLMYPATTRPALDASGLAETPPTLPGGAITPPDNIWDSITSPIHVYPYGWVLDSREVDEIPGTELGLVTDTYIYYQRYKPGG